MKAKPMFKERILDNSKGGRCFLAGTGMRYRITDAREPSARKALEKALQNVLDVLGNQDVSLPLVRSAAYDAGFAATVRDGKVRVR
jgi:hypothetical protein